MKSMTIRLCRPQQTAWNTAGYKASAERPGAKTHLLISFGPLVAPTEKSADAAHIDRMPCTFSLRSHHGIWCARLKGTGSRQQLFAAELLIFCAGQRSRRN